jgi:hypothetical protein
MWPLRRRVVVSTAQMVAEESEVVRTEEVVFYSRGRGGKRGREAGERKGSRSGWVGAATTHGNGAATMRRLSCPATASETDMPLRKSCQLLAWPASRQVAQGSYLACLGRPLWVGDGLGMPDRLLDRTG